MMKRVGPYEIYKGTAIAYGTGDFREPALVVHDTRDLFHYEDFIVFRANFPKTEYDIRDFRKGMIYSDLKTLQAFKEDVEKKPSIDFEKIEGRIEYAGGYRDYLMAHPFEAVECSRNNGTLPDLDWMVHLNGLLKMPVSYDLFHFINSRYDGSLLELGKDDYAMLVGWVNEYASGMSADE